MHAAAAATAVRAQAAGELSRWPSGITYQLLAVRPKSRGSVTLASADIAQQPAIDLGYLTDSEGADRETLRAGIRLSRKLAGSAAWGDLIDRELHPGTATNSDAEIDEYIAKTLHSGNALVGTCAMGLDAAAGAVVSPENLKVHGVNGLRVVDSSVIPVIPGGQTGAPVVMVAERAAALMGEARQSVAGAQPALRQPALA
jgi:fatty acid photodecarboxylase